MRNRDLKSADWMRWGHSVATATEPPSGYLKRCMYCGDRIYMKCDYDGQWRPYESWVNGSVEEGEWIIHECEG